MATVTTIGNRALRLLGELNSGVSATALELADLLIALNAMLDSWRNDKLMCYAIQDESIPLVSGNTTRTIGPTGNLASTRPVEIVDAYVVYGGVSLPVKILTAEEYAAIPDKTATSTYPYRIYYAPTMSNGTVYMHPLPNATSVLHVLTRTPFTAFATVSDTVTLPPGWEEALAANLAIAYAPEAQTKPSQEVIKMALESKASIKRVNSRPIKAYTELAMLVGTHRSNILTDSP